MLEFKNYFPKNKIKINKDRTCVCILYTFYLALLCCLTISVQPGWEINFSEWDTRERERDRKTERKKEK